MLGSEGTSRFCFQCLKNNKDHSIDILHDVAIPKAENVISPRFQILRSFRIVLLLFQMLTSIEFDD